MNHNSSYSKLLFKSNKTHPKRLGPTAECQVDLHFAGCTARDEVALVDQAADDAQRIMQRALRLAQHLRSATC